MGGVNEADSTWERMLRKLVQFAKRHRHCAVPTNYQQDPALGRWVAAQRHRRRVGLLSASRIAALDALGFLWSPSAHAWETMFAELAKFRQREGHCEVPTKWAHDPRLADWVQRQRLAKKRGRLERDRIRRLEALGFTWAIYRGSKERREVREKERASEPAPHRREQRLYCIRSGVYVQHDGGPKPHPELEAYARANHGEMPPYIPLPVGPVAFALGDGWGSRRVVKWKGQGPIPRDVLEYVCENGHLPAYE